MLSAMRRSRLVAVDSLRVESMLCCCCQTVMAEVVPLSELNLHLSVYDTRWKIRQPPSWGILQNAGITIAPNGEKKCREPSFKTGCTGVTRGWSKRSILETSGSGALAPAKILWSQVQSRRANPSEHKAHRPSFFSSGLPHVLPQDHECHISRILW